MTTGGGTALRMLLILSAIDLLSSALTAGVVLFVILVGGDAGQAGGSAQQGGAGLNFVEIIDSSGETQLFKQEALGVVSASAIGLDTQLFPEQSNALPSTLPCTRGNEETSVHSDQE